MPRETWCRKEKKNASQNSTNSGARYSQGTTKCLPPPDLTKPKAKKPKVDDDNPTWFDNAQHFSARTVSNGSLHNSHTTFCFKPPLIKTTYNIQACTCSGSSRCMLKCGCRKAKRPCQESCSCHERKCTNRKLKVHTLSYLDVKL